MSSAIIYFSVLIILSYLLLTDDRVEHNLKNYIGIFSFGTTASSSTISNQSYAFGINEPATGNYSTITDVQNIDYRNDLPYVTEYANSPISASNTLVVDGMMVLIKSIPTDLHFNAAGGSENGLVIEPINRYNTTFFNMLGTSGFTYVGFFTDDLNYTGQYISLITGNVFKSGKGQQISFVFAVQGNKGNYTLIYILGPSKTQGWRGSNYYETISSYSSKLINLRDMLQSHGDNYSLVKKISITIQPEMATNMEFRIDLDKTTENLPAKPPAEKSYYVVGSVQKYNSALLDSKYFFHNLQLFKLADIKYLAESEDVNIEDNGWYVYNVTKSKDEESGLTSITITAERNIHYQDIFPMIFNFDIYKSLMEMGAKDLLLMDVILACLALFFIKTRKAQLI